MAGVALEPGRVEVLVNGQMVAVHLEPALVVGLEHGLDEGKPRIVAKSVRKVSDADPSSSGEGLPVGEIDSVRLRQDLFAQRLGLLRKGAPFRLGKVRQCGRGPRVKIRVPGGQGHRPFMAGASVVEPAQVNQGVAGIFVRLAVTGIQVDRGLERSQCLPVFAARRQRAPKQQMAGAVLCVDPQFLLAIFGRFFVVAFVEHHQGVDEAGRKPGIQQHRHVVPELPRNEGGQILVRLQGGGELGVVKPLRQFPHPGVDDGQGVGVIPAVRVQIVGALDQGQRPPGIVHLKGHDAKHANRLGIFGLGGKSLVGFVDRLFQIVAEKETGCPFETLRVFRTAFHGRHLNVGHTP